MLRRLGIGVSAAVVGSAFLYGFVSPRLVVSASAKGDQKKTVEEQKSTPDLPSGLNPSKYNKFKLREVQPVNHNTSVFVFGLRDPLIPLSLPVASFLLVRANINNEDIVRPYTPIDQDSVGEIRFLVKKYDTGKLSKYLHAMKVGDEIEIQGPLPKIKYSTNMKKHIGMLAGGTGITPMLQVLESILKDPNDKTRVTLLFGNISEDDILLKSRLDDYSRKFKDQFSVIYTIDKAQSPKWKGEVGYITDAMIKKYMPTPSPDNLILVCGPPGFMKSVSGEKNPDYSQGPLSGHLSKLGYTSEGVFKF